MRKRICLMFMRLFAWCEKIDHCAYNFFERKYDRLT